MTESRYIYVVQYNRCWRLRKEKWLELAILAANGGHDDDGLYNLDDAKWEAKFLKKLPSYIEMMNNTRKPLDWDEADFAYEVAELTNGGIKIEAVARPKGRVWPE